LDLEQWMGAESLLRASLEAAREGEWRKPFPVSTPIRTGQSVPAGVVVGVLIYAYSRGWYWSDQIEQRVHTDAVVRAVLGELELDEHELRRVRSARREQVREGLMALFRRIWESRFGSVRPSHAAAPESGHVSNPLDARLEIGFQQWLMQEAEQRLHRAVTYDSNQLDV
jgi:hypothetical protein